VQRRFQNQNETEDICCGMTQEIGALEHDLHSAFANERITSESSVYATDKVTEIPL
jgi:hypothetical protein